MSPRELHDQAMELAEKSDYLRRAGKEWKSVLRESLSLEIRSIGLIPPVIENEPTRQLICESAIELAGQLEQYDDIKRICHLALSGYLMENQSGFFESSMRRASFMSKVDSSPEKNLDVVNLALISGRITYGFAEYHDVQKREAVMPPFMLRAQACRNRVPFEKGKKSKLSTKESPRLLRVADSAGSYCMSFALVSPVQPQLGNVEQFGGTGLADYLIQLCTRIDNEDPDLLEDIGADYLATFKDFLNQLRPDGKRVGEVELSGGGMKGASVRLFRKKRASRTGEESSEHHLIERVGVLQEPILQNTVSLSTSKGVVKVFVDRESLKTIVKGYFGDEVVIQTSLKRGKEYLESIDYPSSDDASEQKGSEGVESQS